MCQTCSETTLLVFPRCGSNVLTFRANLELSLAVIVHPDEIIIVSIGAIRSEKILWKSRIVDTARLRFDFQNLYASDSILSSRYFAFLKLVLLAFTVLDNGYSTTECCKNKAERLSLRMEKPTICIGENKGADQLRRNCEADQRLCFRYTDSTIPLLSKSKISSL